MNIRNSITLIGHLGKAPEIMQNENGLYGYLNLATKFSTPDGNGGWTDNTDWHHCQFNDAIARRLEKLALGAGDMLGVEGRLTYQKKDDHNNAVIKIGAFEVLKRKEPKAETAETKPNDLQVSQPDDDLPF